MAQFFLPISNQLLILNELIVQASRSLKKAPEGTLVIHQKSNRDQYYWCTGTGRSYIPKKDIALAQKLAQKSYDKAFLQLASLIRDDLECLQQQHCERSASFMYQPLAKVYSELPQGRQTLIHPYVLPDTLYIQEWLSEPYEGLPFTDQDPMIFTDRGERVRSKSEKILADRFNALGIPYRYEYPLYLSAIGTIHPDFTLLDLAERRIIYLEHFGLIQDPAYSFQAMNKIDCYSADGYYQGDQLLCTFEGGRYVFQSAIFESMLRHRLSIS